MKYCSNCGTALEDAALFCTNCGMQQTPAAPAPVEEAAVYTAPETPVTEPAYVPAPETVPTTAYVGSPEAPAYEPVPNYAPNYAPVYPVSYAPAPTASVGDKVLGGVGFGLSMLGMFLALITLIVSMAAMAEEVFGILTIVYVIMFIIPSILGTAFCSRSRKNGHRIGLTACGKTFGIIGIVLFGLAFLMAVGGMS